ncbi:MAG: methyl-accepting chemotaxis protein, partial [Gallionellaceae bacterium]
MFSNLTMKGKFFALEFVSFFMFLAMAIFGLLQLHGAIQDEKESVSRLQVDITIMTSIDAMDTIFLKEVKLAKDVWIRGSTPEIIKKYRGEYVKQQVLFNQHHASALKGLKKLAEGHSGINTFVSKLGKLSDEQKTVYQKYLTQIDAHQGNASESDAAVAGIDRQLTNQIVELRKVFVKFVEDKGTEKITLADEDFQHRRNLIIVWVVASLGLSLFLVGVIIRSVFGQLGGDPKEVAKVVNTMAAGDFSQRAKSTPIAGSLLANAYHMQTSMRDMIDKVKNQANQVGDMAHNLSASAQQIVGNANQESDAVSSMASAIEEMSVSTTHISNQGGHAKEISEASRTNAEDGAQVVNKTVSGLLTTAQEIETASAEVSRLGEDATRIIDVVKVIKEIADQTNLLALNAAIEAARAGEQGRGFAVVADEVRKLAERTSNATNEINEMSGKISEVVNHALDSMGKVVATTQQGVSDAETAQNSIASIQQSFGEVANVIEDISNALSEQTVASTDLAKNTERVAQMSEENSGAAQSLLGLANELEDKAAQMRDAVAVF